MLVILALYAVLVWLLFWKLKLLKWGWASGVLTVFCGAFIFAVLLVMFNYLTPSGTFVVTSRTVDIAPNISGRVIAIPVKPDQPVKAGATLLQIDPAPFRSKVDQLQASLAQARQQADQLRAGYVQTTAVVDGLTRQLERQRLDERPPAGSRDARDQFRLQDTRSDMLQSQLQVARAALNRAPSRRWMRRSTASRPISPVSRPSSSTRRRTSSTRRSARRATAPFPPWR